MFMADFSVPPLIHDIGDKKMIAVVIKGPGEVMLTELEQPTIRPDDVLIRSRAVGICGSDVELYRGIRPVGYYQYPIVPGHEWAGEISAVGDRVRNQSRSMISRRSITLSWNSHHSKNLLFSRILSTICIHR